MTQEQYIKARKIQNRLTELNGDENEINAKIMCANINYNGHVVGEHPAVTAAKNVAAISLKALFDLERDELLMELESL